MAINGLAVQKAIDAFLAKIPSGLAKNECWPYPTRRKDGYATYGDGSCFDGDVYVHRLMWRSRNAWLPVPKGYEIDHKCFTRSCVNPAHLRLLTLAENRKQRKPKPKKSHCPQGHPYKGKNLYVNPTSGARTCRTCTKAAGKRSAQRKLEDSSRTKGSFAAVFASS